MSWLELDGSPAAAEYHFADGTTTYAYQGGVDPERLAEEPGRLSTILCLRAAIAEGHSESTSCAATSHTRPIGAPFRSRRSTTASCPTAGWLVFVAACCCGAIQSPIGCGMSASTRCIAEERNNNLLGSIPMAFAIWKSMCCSTPTTVRPCPHADVRLPNAPQQERSRFSVLFYHRVADEHPNDWTMSTRAFRDANRLAAAAVRPGEPGRSPVANRVRQEPHSHGMHHVRRRLRRQYAASPCRCLLRYKIPFTYFVSTDHVLGGKPFPHDVADGRPLAPNTLAEMRELAAAGVEIGGHTRSHADLGGKLSEAKLVDEIAGCKRDTGNS